MCSLLIYLKCGLIDFWAQQEVMYDWTAELTGTGDKKLEKNVIRLLVESVISWYGYRWTNLTGQACPHDCPHLQGLKCPKISNYYASYWTTSTAFLEPKMHQSSFFCLGLTIQPRLFVGWGSDIPFPRHLVQQEIWAKLTRRAKAYSISSSVVIVSKIAYDLDSAHRDHNTHRP